MSGNMSRKKRKKKGPSKPENETPGPAPPGPDVLERLSWLRSPWVVVAILALGAVIRLWGITERCFVDPDTPGQFMGGEVYRVTWRWYHGGADRTLPLLDYLDREMGYMAVTKFDNGKPLNLIFRAFIIFLTGRPSIIAHSLMDILLALTAMGLMLRWCHRNLGPGITILAGCLWLVNGYHFQCTGRGYDYSAMMLFGTLAWLAFMNRGEGHVYRQTFFAGLSLGAGILYHYSFFNYLPLLAVFIAFFRNQAGIKGKLLEVVVFVAGFAVFPLAIIGWYQWLTAVTGTPWRWEILSPLFQQGNTFGDMRVSVRFFANGWFMWTFLNGYLFMLLLFAGLVAIAFRHVSRYGWRWSICDDPLFILNGIAAYGLLVWGIYSTTVPRIQMPEIAAWPVIAAVGVHHTTRFVSQKILKGRALGILQALLVAAIMMEQWHRTAPLVHMGAGIKKAMTVMSEAGVTTVGEGVFYGIWPCVSKPKKPVEPTPPLTRWEYLDDYLQINGYDYFYVPYGRLLTHMVMYPGAGHPLMLDAYNRLFARADPVWRFEYGAPIYARIENMNMGWVRQTYSMDAWRRHNPQPTPYDAFIEREQYFDVFIASDVIAAFRESRINLLAQLMILQQRDPNRFRQIAPRFHSFIRYNATNAVVMTEARAAAARF